MPSGNPVDVTSVFVRYRDHLEAVLRAAIPSETSVPEIYDVLRYHLGWLDLDLVPTLARAGKLLRPTLCLLSCEAVGADFRRALPAAAALELLHNFSLIHDDVEDRGLERRGRPTVFARWGEPLAVNAGDAMLVLSELALARATDSGLGAPETLAMLIHLNECCLRLTEGQHLDLRLEGNPSLTRMDYFRLVSGKTASLLGCSARLGALSGSASPERAEAFDRFGSNVGIGFQIQDDVLGIWGDTKATGKPPAADIYGRKVTLPIIDALAIAEPSAARRIAAIYRAPAPTGAEVIEVVELLDRLGVRERSEREALFYVERGLVDLASAQPTEQAGAELVALTRSLLGRIA